jgi:GDPmannose 4,6-dehydratase
LARRALITGISGQDGYYLSKLLLDKGYQVVGVDRCSGGRGAWRLDILDSELAPAVRTRLKLEHGDVTDAAGMMRLVLETAPDEVYHLAAQSHVQVSFENPSYTHHVNAEGTMNLLEASRQLNAVKAVRFFNAATSEMFGGTPGTAPQNEDTPFHPRSPYGSAKAAAFHHTVNYREAFGLFTCNGILYNHESPLRGVDFVTRKITLAAARIRAGLQHDLSLGSLSAQRDWGFAGDYVEAMWLMLNHDQPDDYVIATGECHSVQEFVDLAFNTLGLRAADYLHVDPQFFRPSEAKDLRGNATKARETLGWRPTTSFHDLVNMMVISDLERAERERKMRNLEVDGT